MFCNSQPVFHLSSCCPQPQSVNYPQEDDETLSKDGAMDIALDSPQSKQGSPSTESNSSVYQFPNGIAQPFRTQCCAANSSFTSNYSRDCCSEKYSYAPYQRPLGLPVGYSPPAPFPSRTEASQSTFDWHKGAWCHSMPISDSSLDGDLVGPLPSYIVSGGYSNYPSERSSHQPHCSSIPLPGRCSPDQGSLEQPRSLHSLPMLAIPQNLHHYPHPQWRMACGPQCPMEVLRIDPIPHQGPGNHRPHPPSCKLVTKYTTLKSLL